MSDFHVVRKDVQVENPQITAGQAILEAVVTALLLDISLQVDLSKVDKASLLLNTKSLSGSALGLHGVNYPLVDPSKREHVVFAIVRKDDGLRTHELHKSISCFVTAVEAGAVIIGPSEVSPPNPRMAGRQVAHGYIRPNEGVEKDFASEKVDSGDLNLLAFTTHGHSHLTVDGNGASLINCLTGLRLEQLEVPAKALDIPATLVGAFLFATRISDWCTATGEYLRPVST